MMLRGSARVFSVSAIILGVSLAAASCEKVPLTAPTGSTIVLSAGTNVLPINGTADIVATLLEAAGTPPHSGTIVSFTTTLGTIEPADARTDASGRVIVKFMAGSGNGTATITATSGAATTGTNGAIRIAIGTAAVGRVSMTANPNPVSANGGVSTIVANVVDTNGNVLPLVSVSFSTTAGSLANSFANTDANGVAQTTLRTSAQATVTATVGAQAPPTTTPPAPGAPTTPPASTGQATATVQVNVNPVPTVSISAPAGTLTANSPIVFTISAQPGTNSTAQIRNVRVNFGDGDVVDLGAVSGTGITVQHRYDDDDTYTVRVTVTDSFGEETTAATVIVVQPEPPLGVTINFVKAGTVLPVTVTFTATVTPSTTTVSSYFWNFGDGQSTTTTSNQSVHPYTVAGTYPVTVVVTTTSGQTATGQTAVAIP